MTLEQAFDSVKAAGLLFNNLFQLDNGMWRCNLRSSTDWFAFGEGVTPSLAIAAATKKNVSISKKTGSNLADEISAESDMLADMLS